MSFLDLAQKRYSVRAYRPDPVEPEKLAQILEAARLAPTASNRQPFGIVVKHVRGCETELAKVYHRPWFLQAPLVLCVCATPASAWVRGYDGKNHAEVDATIIMDHLILAATDLGLGTCWIAHFDPAAAREVFSLPEGVVPVLLTPLGYPADQPQPKQRKPLGELVHEERW